LPAFDGPPLGPLGPACDLFGDGSLVLAALPGHARGQIGMLASTERGRFFFAADSCYGVASIRERRPPHRLTHLVADDPAALRATIERLHAFTQANPDVVVVPSHCPEAYRRYAESVP